MHRPPPDALRLYAVVRGDLKMPPGKLAAQCGHAFIDTYLRATVLAPDRLIRWKTDHGIKIVLDAPDLAAFQLVHDELQKRGLPSALITDHGYTVFNGVHTVTCLWIWST